MSPGVGQPGPVREEVAGARFYTPIFAPTGSIPPRVHCDILWMRKSPTALCHAALRLIC